MLLGSSSGYVLLVLRLRADVPWMMIIGIVSASLLPIGAPLCIARAGRGVPSATLPLHPPDADLARPTDQRRRQRPNLAPRTSRSVERLLTMLIDVFVEIPKGARNKYEVDHDSGRLRLDRTLFTATQYPAEYGFIENTLGLDNDPLDAMVLTSEPTFPGCLITGRVIGMFCMRDENGQDDKIICVPAGDPRWEATREVMDIPDYDRLEIQHFFEVYKQLEPGKQVADPSWEGAEYASSEIDNARQRFTDSEHDR